MNGWRPENEKVRAQIQDREKGTGLQVPEVREGKPWDRGDSLPRAKGRGREMKIIKLSVENFMRLAAIEIEPDGSTVLITGKNENGKTSILNSIWSALAGGEAAREIKKPIREGMQRAEIRLDLGDFIVTRTFTGNGKTKLKVENGEGATYKSPQALLDSFVGRLSFDPLAFANLPEREQAATLREMTGIDTSKHDERREGYYEARTSHNRRAGEYADKLKGRAEPSDDLPTTEIKMSDILDELRDAEAEERENRDTRDELDIVKEQAQDISTSMEEFSLSFWTVSRAITINFQLSLSVGTVTTISTVSPGAMPSMLPTSVKSESGASFRRA